MSTLNSAIPGWVLGRLGQASDGNFYGTIYGGDGRRGSVFRITSTGAYTTLHAFNGRDGNEPLAGVIQASEGAFYGTTRFGCTFDNGTVYRMTPDGELTVLHSFAGGSEGSQPFAPLVEGPDGNFYGTTLSGGGSPDCALFRPSCGTVYRITPSGMLTVVHAFIGDPITNSREDSTEAVDCPPNRVTLIWRARILASGCAAVPRTTHWMAHLFLHVSDPARLDRKAVVATNERLNLTIGCDRGRKQLEGAAAHAGAIRFE